jgi:hypothetical protein
LFILSLYAGNKKEGLKDDFYQPYEREDDPEGGFPGHHRVYPGEARGAA